MTGSFWVDPEDLTKSGEKYHGASDELGGLANRVFLVGAAYPEAFGDDAQGRDFAETFYAGLDSITGGLRNQGAAYDAVGYGVKDNGRQYTVARQVAIEAAANSSSAIADAARYSVSSGGQGTPSDAPAYASTPPSSGSGDVRPSGRPVSVRSLDGSASDNAGSAQLVNRGVDAGGVGQPGHVLPELTPDGGGSAQLVNEGAGAGGVGEPGHVLPELTPDGGGSAQLVNEGAGAGGVGEPGHVLPELTPDGGGSAQLVNEGAGAGGVGEPGHVLPELTPDGGGGG